MQADLEQPFMPMQADYGPQTPQIDDQFVDMNGQMPMMFAYDAQAPTYVGDVGSYNEP